MSVEDEENEVGVDLLAVVDAGYGQDDFVNKEDEMSREAEHCTGVRKGGTFRCTEAEGIDEDIGLPNSDGISGLRVVDA